MFVIEHFHCPGKFCWQHCSRISSLSGPTAIPRHLRICIWPGVEALLLHDPTISHHPVSYLGLGFETQKPRTDSFVLCVLLRHLFPEAQRMGCLYYQQSEQLVQFAGTEGIPGTWDFWFENQESPRRSRTSWSPRLQRTTSYQGMRKKIPVFITHSYFNSVANTNLMRISLYPSKLDLDIKFLLLFLQAFLPLSLPSPVTCTDFIGSTWYLLDVHLQITFPLAHLPRVTVWISDSLPFLENYWSWGHRKEWAT